jgi:hypothetical protein
LWLLHFFCFVVLKLLRNWKKEVAPAASGPTQEELLTQIRDLLKKVILIHILLIKPLKLGGFFFDNVTFCYFCEQSYFYFFITYFCSI